MERLRIAQYIAGVATFLTIFGMFIATKGFSNAGPVVFCIGIAVGIVSYLFGGFGKACSISMALAKFGWTIVPFPYDILTFLVTFMLSIIVFLFFPIIPVRRAYKESES